MKKPVLIGDLGTDVAIALSNVEEISCLLFETAEAIENYGKDKSETMRIVSRNDAERLRFYGRVLDDQVEKIRQAAGALCANQLTTAA